MGSRTHDRVAQKVAAAHLELTCHDPCSKASAVAEVVFLDELAHLASRSGVSTAAVRRKCERPD